MPGKWGGAHLAHPPRSANELGCQANGGAHAGHAPPRSANDNGSVHTCSVQNSQNLPDTSTHKGGGIRI